MDCLSLILTLLAVTVAIVALARANALRERIFRLESSFDRVEETLPAREGGPAVPRAEGPSPAVEPGPAAPEPVATPPSERIPAGLGPPPSPPRPEVRPPEAAQSPAAGAMPPEPPAVESTPPPPPQPGPPASVATPATAGSGYAVSAEEDRPAIDWERWLGVRGAAVLAGVFLALAGLYFVRYSIEQGWISPIVRVTLALVVGVAAVVGSEPLRPGRAGAW